MKPIHINIALGAFIFLIVGLLLVTMSGCAKPNIKTENDAIGYGYATVTSANNLVGKLVQRGRLTPDQAREWAVKIDEADRLIQIGSVELGQSKLDAIEAVLLELERGIE